MSNPLTNLNVKRIHELLELLSPAMAHELVIDDSEGVLKPKRLSLSNLAKLFIPYNNAVNDLNLGEHDITALRGLFDAIHLNTEPASIPSDDDIGAMYWDSDALTYSVVLPNGVRGQFGEEMFVLVTRYSTAPNPILNGTPVYTVGEQGQRPTVAVARADDKDKIKVTGIVTHDITNQGRITTFGLVRAIPLARKPAGETWVAGNYLWLAPTGGMTNVEPSRPTPNVRLGLITNVTGSASFDMLVYIRPAMGMYDLYDVNGDAPIEGSEFSFDFVNGYWKATNRLNTLEAGSETEGSVLKTIKDTAEDATFTDTSGLDSTTLKDAINEIYAEKAVANGLASLDATGKIPVAQLPVSAMEFKGGWDASSGAYPLTPDVGDFWTVSVAGTTEGVEFDAGDAIVYNGATWDKINKVEIAEEVSYDNSSSGLVATNVQDAIDELDERVDDTETALTTLNADDTTEGSVAKAVKDNAQDATYDNSGTGIEATTVKTAITELDARLVDAEAHVYGLDFNETTGVCTRLLDAVGLTVGAPDGVNPIASDFDSCYPWSAMHHVKIALDGTRKEPFEDGYDTFDGEIMRHTPAYWYKDYRSGGHRYLYISDKKKAGFLYQKAYDIASFDASKVGTSYRSRVGEAPKTNESYTTFITGFYAQGDGKWSMYDQLHSEFMLSVIEAGTLNHKAAYGRGINSGMPYGSTSAYLLTADTINGNDVVLADSAQPFYVGMTVQIGTTYTNNSVAQDRIITNVVRAGGVLTLTLDGAPFSAVIGNSCVTWGQSVPQEQFDAIGDGSGYILQHASANRSHVCYRGVWDLWGNVWQFYAGFMRYNSRYYGCTDPTKYKITNPVGADGWIDLGIGEYAENGYQQIREGVVIDGGTIDVPITWGSVASSETYYSAYLYNFNSTYSSVRVLLLGGSWDYGGIVSLVSSDGYGSPSSSLIYFGSRLIRS